MDGNGCEGAIEGPESMTIVDNPTATISGGGDICQGQSVPVTIDLTGNGPWTVVYNNGIATDVEVISNTSVFTFDASTAEGTYSLVSVVDTILYW